MGFLFMPLLRNNLLPMKPSVRKAKVDKVMKQVVAARKAADRLHAALTEASNNENKRSYEAAVLSDECLWALCYAERSLANIADLPKE